VLGILLSLFVVFSHGLNTVHFYTELYADPIKIRDIFGPSDAGSYLSAAIQLDTISSLSPETNWIINLWPPGMLVLEALILRFLQNDFYFGVVLGVLTAFAWGSFLGYLACLVHKLYGKLLAILLLVLVVSVGPIHDWILNYGLFYADGFGALFLLVGITFFILTHGQKISLSRKLSLGVLAGISFALSAYFRASYINILYALLATALVCLAVLVVLRVSRNSEGYSLQIKRAIESSAVFVTATFAMFICVNPWMSYVENEVRGTRDWSVVGDNFIDGMWVERGEMPGFLSEGGIGWACKIDSDKCSELTELKLAQPTLDITHMQLSEAILVALKNPVEYALDRGKFIGIAWSSSELGQMGDVFNHPLSAFNLVGLLGFFVILVKRFARCWPLFVSITTIYLTLLIPLLIGHIEIRYLLPFKILPLLIPVLLFHVHIVSRSKDKSYFTD
jgi:hypothetical protein